ncbi:MAG: class I SAM-dependent methyltransferase [Betaproteobacteria bacterium]|nr:class I SAM-dependent methyltransferase [Betaproteobacteria bacterium]
MTTKEFWDERYSAPEYIFGTQPNAFLASQRDRLKAGMRALAVADGEGRNGVWLAEQGLDVRSVEISPLAIEKAQRLAQERGVSMHFECADLLAWDWGVARFDLIAAIFIQFVGPEGRAHIFRGMIDALKPGGLLLLQGYTPKQLEFKTGGPPVAENLYTESLLKESFGELEILHLHTHEDFIAEGTHHHGMSALIDMVAQKPQT